MSATAIRRMKVLRLRKPKEFSAGSGIAFSAPAGRGTDEKHGSPPTHSPAREGRRAPERGGRLPARTRVRRYRGAQVRAEARVFLRALRLLKAYEQQRDAAGTLVRATDNACGDDRLAAHPIKSAAEPGLLSGTAPGAGAPYEGCRPGRCHRVEAHQVEGATAVYPRDSYSGLPSFEAVSVFGRSARWAREPSMTALPTPRDRKADEVPTQ